MIEKKKTSSSNESGWTETKRKSGRSPTPTPTPTSLPQDTLDVAHWSVPQRLVQELTATIAGVAFASPEEVRTLVERQKPEVAQGVLCSKDVTGIGLELRVTVRDSKGQPGERKRFLVQLGKLEVTYNKTAVPKGGVMTSRAVKVTMNVQKQLLKAGEQREFASQKNKQGSKKKEE